MGFGSASSAIPVQPVQPSTANSAFAGLNNVTIGLDGLGSAQTLADTNQIKTTFQLHPELQGILGQSRQGLAGGLAATNRSLADDLAALQAGQNAYYNAQHAFNRQAASDAQKAVQARFSQAGLGASSVLGGFLAQQANDARLQELATQQQAIEQAFNRGANQVQLNSSVLGQLAGAQQQPINLATGSLMQGLANADAMARFNAQQTQRADEVTSQLALNAAIQENRARNALAQSRLGILQTGVRALGGYGPISSALANGLGRLFG
ncbi:MAG: hypothetical protein KC474_11900 [Cyanobacteria bacterium HKST-UBA04]|nr:hypothetical protein [Cyanobacteria bacterium HKST-UBA04]